MNILVIGAGVIGTLYAAKLRLKSHRVTVLARGQRLIEVTRNGLNIEDVIGGKRSSVQVETTNSLRSDDSYDLALIAVRRDQLAGIIPELAANRVIPLLLFMLNNPSWSTSVIETVGRDRVLCGFPGAGGTSDGRIVRYALVRQQPTTLGELNGRSTPRARELAESLRDAGFPTSISNDIDGWLKAHAFFITSIGGAIYLAGGCTKLSKDRKTLALMVDGVREGFAALRALGLTITPFGLRVLFTWLPRSFAICYWQRFFATKTAEYVFGGHIRAASGEMHALASDCRALIDKSGLKAPSLVQLYCAIDGASE